MSRKWNNLVTSFMCNDKLTIDVWAIPNIAPCVGVHRASWIRASKFMALEVFCNMLEQGSEMFFIVNCDTYGKWERWRVQGYDV